MSLLFTRAYRCVVGFEFGAFSAFAIVIDIAGLGHQMFSDNHSSSQTRVTIIVWVHTIIQCSYSCTLSGACGQTTLMAMSLPCHACRCMQVTAQQAHTTVGFTVATTLIALYGQWSGTWCCKGGSGSSDSHSKGWQVVIGRRARTDHSSPLRTVSLVLPFIHWRGSIHN